MSNPWTTEWWQLLPLAADPSRLPKLPTEVCERILDEYDASTWDADFQDRKRTFAACCLTCRAWLPRSRYHLFKFVTVRSKEEVKQVSRLLHSIPVLRTRVKTLLVVGSKGGKRDASWIGLVGFHLGPKLKALRLIQMQSVDFSVMKLEAYTSWGAFNRAWQPNAMRELHLWECTVTHLNQLVRLAFVTKAEFLNLDTIHLDNKAKSALLAPAFLSSAISLPLSKFKVILLSSDLVLPIPWHTLAKQSPSLSSVEITCRDNNLDPSSPAYRPFLVSILYMFHRMQRHNDTNRVLLSTGPLPTITMKTRPYGETANTDNSPLATQPCLYRELVVTGQEQPYLESIVKVLTLVENAMVLTNYTNRRFHRIEIFDVAGLNDFQPDFFQSLDGVLSRLSIATHDVHVIIEENLSRLQLFQRRKLPKACIAPWVRKRFPMLTAIVPNAFCDPEAGHPCNSHPTQANDIKVGGRMVGG